MIHSCGAHHSPACIRTRTHGWVISFWRTHHHSHPPSYTTPFPTFSQNPSIHSFKTQAFPMQPNAWRRCQHNTKDGRTDGRVVRPMRCRHSSSDRGGRWGSVVLCILCSLSAHLKECTQKQWGMMITSLSTHSYLCIIHLYEYIFIILNWILACELSVDR